MLQEPVDKAPYTQQSGSYIQCSTASFTDFCKSCGNFICYRAVVLESGQIFKCSFKTCFLSSHNKETQLNGCWLKTNSSLVLGEDSWSWLGLRLSFVSAVLGLRPALGSFNDNPALCAHPIPGTRPIHSLTTPLQHGRSHLLSINTARVKVTVALDIDWAFVFFNACII